MRRIQSLTFATARRVMALAALVGGLLLPTVSALSQEPPPAPVAPANDNFADAIEIFGSAGNVTGDNSGATVEPLEEGTNKVVTLQKVHAEGTVWYKWTAPEGGDFQFDTTGSIIPTALGVAQGDDIASVTWVPNNSSFIGANQSLINVSVQSNQVYYVAVGGTAFVPVINTVTNNGTNIVVTTNMVVTLGTYQLSWRRTSGYPSAGTFSFSSDMYIAADRDVTTVREAWMYEQLPSVTFVRKGGSSGMVNVRYSVTNDWYTNKVDFEIFGTNITKADGSKEFYTNYAKILDREHRADGLIRRGERPLVAYFWTNQIGTNPAAIVGGEYPAPIVVETNNLTYTNNDDLYVVFYTKVKGASEVAPSAVAGEDYYPTTGTIVFSNYQMSAALYLLLPAPQQAPREPLLNPTVKVEILGIANASEESADLAPPEVSQSSTLVNIHRANVLPATGMRGTNMFTFERSTLWVEEHTRQNGFARLHVRRVSDDYSGSASVQYRIDYRYPHENWYNEFNTQPGSEYATPDNPYQLYGPLSDFTSVSGTLNFGAYEDDQVIDIPIGDDAAVEFNEDLLVQLYFPDPQPTDRWLGYVNTCKLTIWFDDQTAGALDRDHNMDNDGTTSPPYNPNPGANSTVYSVISLDDGTSVIAGDFTAFNATPRNRIARLRADGQLDRGFDPGDGADNFISAMKVDSEGRILIGGAFTSYNRTTRNGIARLQSSGALDLSFDPGLGVDGSVWAMAFAPDDSIYIAGSFNTVNATNRNYIARLKADGSLDSSFDPGAGPDGPIYALAVASDGKIYIGGQFSQISGVARSCIARLNPDGSVDAGFNPRSGVQGPLPTVYTIAQDGERLMIGGSFTSVYGVARNNLARLNGDGSIDLTFDPGSGTDDMVYTINRLADGKFLVGGSFVDYNETRRIGLARIYSSGVLDTTFMDSSYNQYAGVPTVYFNPMIEPRSFVFSTSVEADGKVMIAGNFDRVGGGELRDDIRTRRNVARLIGGETPGPGNIELMDSNYNVDNPIKAGEINDLFLKMTRLNGNLASASVVAVPYALGEGAGNAQAGVDFLPFYSMPTWQTTYPWDSWQVTDGTYGQNYDRTQTVRPGFGWEYTANDLWLTTLFNTNRGNRVLGMRLTLPQSSLLLGGEPIAVGVALGRKQAEIMIVDNARDYGTLGFSSANYLVNEGDTAQITVVRSGGSDDRVLVRYATENLGATNGVNYQGVTNWLVFNAGVTSQTFTVKSLSRSAVEKNQTVKLRLSDPAGGATLGLTNAVLTIVDKNVAGGYVEFSSATYTTNESAGVAQITVRRLGSSVGILSVKMSTADGNAVGGVNYAPLTTNLVWNSGDAQPKLISLPIYKDGLYQDTNFLTILLKLSDPKLNSVANPSSLGLVKDSVLTIVNEDYRGTLAFNQTDYTANENGGNITIVVNRTGGSSEAISVNYAAQSLTAFDGLDFIGTSGTLFFAPGEVSKSFDIQIINNQIEDVDRQIALSLSGANPAEVLGTAAAVVHLLDDESVSQPPGFVDTEVDPLLGVEGNVFTMVQQPNGKYLLGGEFVRVNDMPRNRIARINEDGSLDETFSSTDATAGANDSVLSMICQTDGRVLIGGQFSYVNGTARNYLARLMANGMVDSSFNPGAGPESTVLALAETFVDGSRRVLAGGAFATFNGLARNFIVRLTEAGQVDAAFNPSLSPNGPVHCILIDSEGRAIIGGDFTMVNGIQRMHIARILPNGVLDNTFDPGAGANGSVRALALQMDGKILAGGLFTQMGGLSAGYVARLNSNGLVDPSFSTGTGADDAVTAIVVQPDGRILLGGQFKSFNSVTRHSFARLDADGSVDTTINLGTGANSFVSAIALQPDRRMWLGGGFTEWDGQPASHLVRIYGGSIAGPGALEFDAPEYLIGESGTNATLTIRRRGGTGGTIGVTLATADGSAISGKNYLGFTTNLVFPPGETMEQVVIPVMRDYEITPDLEVFVSLLDPQPQDGPTLGNQPTTTLKIVNEDCAISFSAATYLRNENAPEKSATITLVRSGSVQGTSTVDFLTSTNGTASIGTNYWPVNRQVIFRPGESNAVVQVPLVYDPRSSGDLTVTMELTNAVNALLFSPSSAILTVLDVDKMPGQFALTQTNYVVSESAGTALITVVRTNGRSGTVTVNYNTVPGTAQPGVKYIGTNGVLVFGENELVKSFAVPLIQNTLVDGHLNFTVALSNPTGGSSFAGPSSSLVTIMDDDLGVGFASPVFLAAENSGSATLTLTRIGTNGVTTVQYYTTNSTAIAGTNYVAESGSITFTNGESLKLMSIDLLHDPRVSGDLSFNVVLHNPSAPAQLFNPSTAAVVVLDSDPGLAFTNAVFGVRKSDTNVLISVMRTNANTGNVTVRYATTNLTALAGVDYAAASGQLTFSNGIAMQSFTIPIINNRLLQEDLEFGIRLFNPTDGAQLIEPSFARVIITNDISGFSFSSPVYTVRENGVSREVTVRRTGFLENTVVVDYTTRDFDNADSRPDAARAGVNYVATSGTFIFTNGETVKTFEVPITDNSKLEGNKSFMVGLTPRQGNAVAVDPSAATITIIENDGSLIVPAGAVLVSESGPVNGMIDTNETVTMLFSLRNASGTNTANLTASLLATNGVVNPSGPRTYGVLLTNGASAHQPFTFTANATNGQTIRAFLRVADGEFTSQVAFDLAIGRTVTTYSNATSIVINDKTNATPYPSAITVSGLQGAITKATVTLTNIYHSAPKDVSILLVAPTGQKTYLMSKTGGTSALKRVTLTFDDAAPSTLSTNQIVSGEYKPTALAYAAPPFPVPAPPGPYSTNLSVFNGLNPNGSWALYVYDDTQLDTGVISNGWVLNLTTSGPIPDSADLGIAMRASEDSVVATSNLVYSLAVTNFGPSTASNVFVTNSLPAGGVLLASQGSKGTFAVASGKVVWNIGTLTLGGYATADLQVQANTVGNVVNAAEVTAFTADNNPANSYAEVRTLVTSPRADLTVGLVATPSPLMLGGNVTYQISVTNLGPASATALTVTHQLEAGVIPVSASPAGYVITTSGGASSVTFTNLGLLANDGVMNLEVVAKPTLAGTITGITRVSSSAIDPLKGNNTAAAKTIVEPLSIGVVRSGAGLVLSWNANAANYTLEYADSLAPNAVWTAVPAAQINQASEWRSFRVETAAGSRYFRLKAQP